MGKLTYGINVGVGTLGWCVLDEDERKVVALNVRAFDVPQNPKTKQSYCAARGMARRRRRTIVRRRNVKMHAIRLMAEYGLIEPVRNAGGAIDFKKSAAILQDAKGDTPVLELRREALDRVVTPRELSRLLYWLAGHRGYIPHGEAAGAQGADAKDSQKVLKALAANAAEFEGGEWRTVGEMLAARGSARNKGGDYSLCVENRLLEDELRVVFESQERLRSPLFENGALSGLLEAFATQCMGWLSPTDAQDVRSYSKVSGCIYFGDEEAGSLKAAARCCLSFEMASAYAALRNVRFAVAGEAAAGVPDDVVERAIAALFSARPIDGAPKAADKVTYRNLRKWAGLAADEEFLGIAADDEKKDVWAPKAWMACRTCLSADLLARLRGDAELADACMSVLAYTSREATMRSALSGEVDLGISGVSPEIFGSLAPADVDELLGLPYSTRAFAGYGTRSARALRMIVGEFSGGAASLFEAEENLGLYARRKSLAAGEPADFLPPFSAYDSSCDNPVVLRAMAEARMVVNALIREYGRPSTIRIDWGRELGMSSKEREKMNKENKRREKRRAALRQKAAAILGIEPESVRAFDVVKLDLLDEQLGMDLITGEKLEARRVLLEDGYAQVGHVLPYSRSMDDSRANKILCRAKTIQDKGDKTCFEWLGDTPTFAKLAERLESEEVRKSVPKRKRDGLLTRTFAQRESDYVSRNLNDDRYAAKRLKEYLSACLRLEEGGAGVVAIPGAIIPKLRFSWGFPAKAGYPQGSIMHSATDACVLAACSQEAVAKAAWAASRENFVSREVYRKLLADSVPWPGLAEQAAVLETIAIPSHAPGHRVTGKMFNETVYRLEGVNEAGYANISVRGKKSNAGNYRVADGGAALLPAELALVQLWWDPDGKVKGKKTPGAILADPVYACDVKAWLEGTHVSRAGTSSKPLAAWEPISAEVLDGPRLELYAGDFLLVKGQPRVYCGYTISGCNWILADPRCNRKDETSRKLASADLSLKSLDITDIEIPRVGPLGYPMGLPGGAR